MSWLLRFIPTSDIIGWILPLATGWISTQLYDLLDKASKRINDLPTFWKQGIVIIQSALITAVAAVIPGICGSTEVAACTTSNLDTKMIAAALVAFAIKHSKQIKIAGV